MNYKKVKYKAGMPLDYDCVTRSGLAVQVCGHKLDAIKGHVIIGWINGVCQTWYENGDYTGTEHEYDLFALVETEIGFINIHEDSHGKWADERIYDYRGVAEENGRLSPTYLTTLEIEL
jgi:hypothetical protein